MITRSKRDESYEYFELPEPKRKRQKKDKLEGENVVVVESLYLEPEQPEQPEPNISIAYYERPPLYEVNIDFDEAHNEWVKNKVKIQNGCYKYKKEEKVSKRRKGK